ncbi:uncharacterized protein L969DRAFT_96762 [Mixia osmundae IAM 14324]|uniref:Uncharacterized protein n=1 Tax=Mixia osmundae (strain CBS 9802 / IAM 14324 / JCM 22182 / KY 12970) TaxID=764103 RepID=G7DZN0_MIXOS|nr:uncharacterized protein L969DRAFT_96762 [Mixia osmundae IAM 14324]KEI37202.1 hypothetical protein L969DRAFT_96762 [Mixia osmundae IAM 14324]GAA96040.1 hypothetical protein E5Q_02701 [Mixia osmundae IAM 14324]
MTIKSRADQLWAQRNRNPPIAALACLTLANIIGIVTGALASASLKNINDAKGQAPILFGDGASLGAASFLGVGGAVIAAGAIAGSATGLVNLLITFRPGYYKKPIMLSLIISSVFLFAAVLAATVIVATGHAVLDVPGVPQSEIGSYVDRLGVTLAYNQSSLGKAYVITGWLSILFTVLATVFTYVETRSWTGVRPSESVDSLDKDGHAGRA